MNKANPIQLGGCIEGTHLLRRYQNKREISPLYHGIGGPGAAMEEAGRVGLSSVTHGANDTTYVLIGGAWYTYGFS